MEIAVIILGTLLKYGPEAAQLASTILHKEDPTQADFDALFAHVRTYDQIVAPKP